MADNRSGDGIGTLITPANFVAGSNSRARGRKRMQDSGSILNLAPAIEV